MPERAIPWAAAAALVLAAGCGDDDNTAPADGTGAESEYCEVALEWAIHELTPVDETDQEAFRAYWDEFEAFEEEARATSPEELEAYWELKIATENESVDVVLEKYDYDVEVLMEQATPEEQAVLDAPPDVAAAQSRIHAYESEVCGAGFPEPADVSYEGEEPGPYCGLVAAGDEQAAEALASGDPVAVEEFVTAQASSADAIVESAPHIIKDDVAAVSEWALGRQAEVIETHGWDLETAIRDGSVQDRFDLNFADEDIREQYARVAAYEEQVCGA